MFVPLTFFFIIKHISSVFIISFQCCFTILDSFFTLNFNLFLQTLMKFTKYFRQPRLYVNYINYKLVSSGQIKKFV